jgi:murein L,D-transpeptidase YafK
MGNLRYWYVAALLLWLAGCAGVPSLPESREIPDANGYEVKGNLTEEQQFIDQLLNKNGLARQKNKPTVIVVHKRSRSLTLYKGLTPLKTYPVVLGKDPLNDKLMQGDMCTPEGVYRVRAKYPHHKWSRFIWIDYPNTQNWLKFARAKNTGKIPLEADIGGQVGIHGTEDEYKNIIGQNWTQGCVSLRNQDMEDLYLQVTEQTLVVIRKD